MDTPQRLIRISEVRARTGLGRSTIYKALAAGAFPSPVKLGRSAVGWHASEVDEWIVARPRAHHGSGAPPVTRAA